MKKYSGFTLIEMLIVMGIIIILMAAGVAGGRFAIQRANRIQKQNAVGNIEQALMGYYTDHRKLPCNQNPGRLLTTTHFGLNDPANCPANPSNSVHGIQDYLDAGQWDGGAAGTYWYYVDAARQTYVVCASLGGVNDEQGSTTRGYGIYCSGSGFQNIPPVNASAPPKDKIYRRETGNPDAQRRTELIGAGSNIKRDWTGTAWQ